MPTITYYTFDGYSNLLNEALNTYDASFVYLYTNIGEPYTNAFSVDRMYGDTAMKFSGIYLKINSSFTTADIMMFSFWFKGQNLCGQYTILDYSNGPGGNQRISLGLQNNTIYAQVVNGSNLGTLSFTTAQTTSLSSPYFTGVAYSSTTNRFVFSFYTTTNNVNYYGIYSRIGFINNDEQIFFPYPILKKLFNRTVSVCLTSDGSRLLWSNRNGDCIYSIWDGTSYNNNVNVINPGTQGGIQGMDITDDGQTIIVAIGKYNSGIPGVPVWAYWTGTGYSAYQTVQGATTSNYISCAITADGSRIAFTDLSCNVYYAVWNGTNYSSTTLISNVLRVCYSMKFSKDGNILFMNLQGSNVLNYFIWNGTSFGSKQSTTVFNGINNAPYGLCLDYSNTIYACNYGGTTLYKTTYTVSLNYLNFTTAQTTSLSTQEFTGVAYSTSTNRFVFASFSSLGNIIMGIYSRIGFTGSDTLLLRDTGIESSTIYLDSYYFLDPNFLDPTFNRTVSVCLTSDGSRLLWSNRNGDCIYSIWDGTSYANNVNAINSGTQGGIQGMDITDDGQTIIVAIGNVQYGISGVPVWAYWTGTGYSAYQTVQGATTSNYISCAITADGSRIAFTDLSCNVYYAVWNGTNYSSTTLISNVVSVCYSMKFSKDGNILFMNLQGSNVLNYFIWNGTSFGSKQSTTVFNGINNTPYGLFLDYNNTIYACSYGSTTLYKTTYTVSNQYTATNFYSAQNLNDSTWRKLTWIINSRNYTYYYFLNNTLIYCDISSGYVFPASTARTQNLLGISSDLPYSAFTGLIDNYVVDNYPLNSSNIQYYTFNTNTASYSRTNNNYTNNTLVYSNVSNVANAANVDLTSEYDSLNGNYNAPILNTINYCVGDASLEFNYKGQNFKMYNFVYVPSSGLSFSFWFRANNSSGQYTILDYSNGPGGNNKISLGLHNNTIYAQIINGIGLNAPTFATGSTVSTGSGTAWPTGIAGFALSFTNNIVIYTDYTAGTIYYKYGITGQQVQISTGYTKITMVAITYDGSRIVWSNRGGYCYYATWGTTNYTGITAINSYYGTKGFNGLDITGDGSVLVVSVGPVSDNIGTPQNPIWAVWNGSGYSSYTDVSGCSSSSYISCAVTTDGSRMAYLDYSNNLLYYAIWNGTTFVQASSGVTITCTKVSDVKFSRDGNILFILTQGSNPIQYCIWTGTTYGPVVLTSAFSSLTSTNGLYVDNTSVYFASLNNGTVYKTTYNISNQYVATNFYSQQNLNDNIWRHLVWTIDPYNTTYKYYLNGSLIYTDVSSGYAFPGSFIQTQNLLGTSTDLSMSYFIGGIDNYTVYNQVFTYSQISSMYNADAYPNAITTSTGGNLVNYYPLNSNSWTAQPALSANYNLVHQYTFDNHTVNDCMVVNTANYKPVYDCCQTNSTMVPIIDAVNYKVGTSSLYSSSASLYLFVNGITISSIGFSVACWFKNISGLVFDFNNSGMDNLSYSPSSGITFKNGLTSYTINGGSGKADGSWHHFAWTISNNGSHNVYIDGSLNATTSSVAPVYGTRINNYIGKGVGNIDDFRIYSGVLSLTDIQSLYNLTFSTTVASLTNYYTMDNTVVQNLFVPNMATGFPVYDSMLSSGMTNIPKVDVSNNILGTGCLFLNGTNNAYIRQVNVTNAGITIAVWLKVSVAPTGSNMYRITDFGLGTTSSGFNNYGFYITNTGIGSIVYIGTNYYTFSFSTTTHIDGGWHHLVLTMSYSTTNTSTHVFYLDGVLVQTSSSCYYPVVGVRINNTIGCSSSNTDFMRGYMNDLRIYNGVMLASHISDLYSSTNYGMVVKIPNLINHYTFEPFYFGGNYLANMSSNALNYDMVLGPGKLPVIDTTTAGYINGKSLYLDATQKQYIIMNNFSVPSSVGLSIACWFKYTSTNGSRLFEFGNTLNSNNDNIAYSPNNGLYYYVGNTIQNTGALSNKSDGTWHHFAWTMVYVASGNTTHKLYLDGIPTTYTTWLYPTVGTRSYNYIGKSVFSTNNYANGWLDDFRVYNGVLTDADVSGVYSSPSYSTTINPVIYYSFSKLGVIIKNPTFLNPSVTTNSYTQVQSIPGWSASYTGGVGNYFIVNGTNPFYSYTLPIGITQYLAVQQRSGSASTVNLYQSVYLDSGTYTLSFYASPRNFTGGTYYYPTQTMSVSIGSQNLAIGLVGNTSIHNFVFYSYIFTITTSANYNLNFNFSNTSSDSSWLITSVQILFRTIPITNPNFTGASSNNLVNTSITGWTDSTGVNFGCGNGNGQNILNQFVGVSGLPTGITTYAFMQTSTTVKNTLYQLVNFPQARTYSVSFYYVGRTTGAYSGANVNNLYNNNILNVSIGNTAGSSEILNANAPPGTIYYNSSNSSYYTTAVGSLSWYYYSTNFTVTTIGSYYLSFQFPSNALDCMILISGVSITY